MNFDVLLNLLPGVKQQREQRRWLQWTITLRQIAASFSFLYFPLFVFKLISDQTGDSQLAGRAMGGMGWIINLITGNASFSLLQQTILWLAGYNFISRLATTSTVIFWGKLAIKHGYDRVLALSLVLLALLLGIFSWLPTYPQLFLLAAVIEGLYIAAFWPIRHTLVSKVFPRASMVKKIGWLAISKDVIKVATPALGGVIIGWLGYQYLYWLSLVFVLGAVITAIKLEFAPERDKISFAEMRSWLNERQYQRLAISFVGGYLNDLIVYLWPLYVYLLFKTVEKVGYIYSLSIALSILFSWLISRFFSAKKSRWSYLFSGGIISAIWIVKTIVVNAWLVTVADGVQNLFSGIYNFMWEKLIISRGKGSQALSYFVYREIIISLNAICWWAVIFMIFLIEPISWVGVFILGAIGVGLSLLIKEKKEPD